MPDEEYLIPIGVADVKREGTDVTIVAWSKMVTRGAARPPRPLAADGISCEVVDPRTLAAARRRRRSSRRCARPTAASSSRKAGRIAGVGAQIAYQIQQDAFGDLDAPVTAGHRRRCADAVRQEPRAPGDALAARGRSRRCGRCCTSTRWSFEWLRSRVLGLRLEAGCSSWTAD
ncbi:MAG: hypothetical protein M0C28_16615 [Candidatus Moduliflexus flocculans]|nr:hypothetical protein [Candidatus Moduliflexus flocculans]